jgi:hypothetical protein
VPPHPTKAGAMMQNPIKCRRKDDLDVVLTITTSWILFVRRDPFQL